MNCKNTVVKAHHTNRVSNGLTVSHETRKIQKGKANSYVMMDMTIDSKFNCRQAVSILYNLVLYILY